MHRLMWLLGSLLVAPLAELPAQEGAIPDPGARVRLSAPELSLHRSVGTVFRAAPDTLVVNLEDRADLIAVPFTAMSKLEVSRGIHSRAGRGVAIGLPAGALAGGAIGYFLTHEEPPYSNGDYGPLGALVGAAAGGALGALIGAVVGASHPGERWAPVPLPVRP